MTACGTFLWWAAPARYATAEYPERFRTNLEKTMLGIEVDLHWRPQHAPGRGTGPGQRANQEIQLAEARQQLERDVANAVRDIGTRWRQYEIAQRALDLSRRKLEIEREKLTVGRSSNFQVLSFENDLRNAENARLNALISYLNAQAELDQTLGTTLELQIAND